MKKKVVKNEGEVVVDDDSEELVEYDKDVGTVGKVPEPKEPEHKQETKTDDLNIEQAFDIVFQRLVQVEEKLREHQHNEEGKAYLPPREL